MKLRELRELNGGKMVVQQIIFTWTKIGGCHGLSLRPILKESISSNGRFCLIDGHIEQSMRMGVRLLECAKRRGSLWWFMGSLDGHHRQTEVAVVEMSSSRCSMLLYPSGCVFALEQLFVELMSGLIDRGYECCWAALGQVEKWYTNSYVQMIRLVEMIRLVGCVTTQQHEEW